MAPSAPNSPPKRHATASTPPHFHTKNVENGHHFPKKGSVRRSRSARWPPLDSATPFLTRFRACEAQNAKNLDATVIHPTRENTACERQPPRTTQEFCTQKWGPPKIAAKLLLRALADRREAYENTPKFAKLHDSPSPAWTRLLTAHPAACRSKAATSAAQPPARGYQPIKAPDSAGGQP
jgi:hypothetical protein